MIRRQDWEESKGVVKGVIMEREGAGGGERGHGKRLPDRGVESLSAPPCEIMFPLCNVMECKARLLYIKGSKGCSGN